jgi:single-strand DNA-binding protein
MQRFLATGRLAADPTLQPFDNGRALCKLRVAVRGLARGEQDVGYIDVSCFGAPGEAAARVLTKGWLVLVDGRLQYRDWKTKEGQARRDWEVVGNVEFLAPPRERDAEPAEPEQSIAA